MNTNNKYNPGIHHRRSVRLCDYDYSQEGLYFITLCIKNRECLFGEIAGGEMRLTEIGEIAQNCWLEIPQHYPNTQLHNFVAMPNHIHGIVEITVEVENIGVENVRVENIRPLRRRPNCESGTIGAIIRGFKIGATKKIGFSVWQRNFWEHVIRDYDDYARIDDYITNNPFRWKEDTFYNE
jgi:REP element-mobilizing transposase RayT